jgi:hypothetical protein
VSRDPREYRINAVRCAELASSVRTPQLKVMFSELSNGWENLALDIEKTDALIADDDMDYNKLD